MDVLVTGATGFVGANLTRRLVAEGGRVRVLARTTSSLRALEGCPTQLVRGDILEPDSLRPAVEGCGLVFHVAADYRSGPGIRPRSTATTWRARATCSRPARDPAS